MSELRKELLEKINILSSRVKDLEQIEHQTTHEYRDFSYVSEYHSLVNQLPGMRGYWPLNVSDGTLWREATGNGPNLTTSGSPIQYAYSSAPWTAFYNAGKLGYLYAADHPRFDITGIETNQYYLQRGVSVGALVQPNTVTDSLFGGVIGKYDDIAGARHYLLYWHGTNKRFAFGISKDGTSFAQISPAITYVQYKYYHISAGYNNATKNIWMRVNGTNYNADLTSSSITSIYSGTADFTIGCYTRATTAKIWNGNIAHAWLCAMDIDANQLWSTWLWDSIEAMPNSSTLWG